MKIKIKSVIFAVSLFFNAAFISLLVLASFSKASRVSFYDPGEGYFSSAAVVTVPSSAEVVFDLIEISLSLNEKAWIQFSIFSAGKQGNILVNPLYDPQVISVTPTGYGIEITALAAGSTLMQFLANDGIRDLALVTVK